MALGIDGGGNSDRGIDRLGRERSGGRSGAALIGGLITGAGLGAAQWFAAKDAFGDARTWIATSAVAYGAGLLVAAAAVGYNTDLGSLAAMGAISGLFLGVGQGLALMQQGRSRLAFAWAAAMPVLLALGWAATTVIGIDVDEQFTVFGASGAIVFTLLSGSVLARVLPDGRGAAGLTTQTVAASH